MQLVITNLTADTLGPMAGLPRGGYIRGPANTETTFTLRGDEDFSAVQERLQTLVDAGSITYRIDADRNDHGSRVYERTLTVAHGDLTEAALSQTIVDDHTFEDGATLVGFRYDLTAEFDGPTQDGPAEVQGNVGPFNLEPGQTLVLAVDGGADATATFDAAAGFDQTKAEPFNFQDGDTFDVTVDGGAPITVTVNAADVVDIDAVTALELKAILDAIPALVAVADVTIQGGTDVRITSKSRGTGSRVVINNGVPAAAGEARVQGNVGPFNLEPGQTLVLAVNGGADATATFDAAAGFDQTKAAPFDLEDGWTLELSIDGGAQVVTFAAADVVDINAVTAQELANILNAQLVGASATIQGGTDVRITSDSKGTGSRVQVTGGLAQAALTFDGETAGTGDAVNIDAVTAAEVKTVVEADIAGVVVTDDPGGIILSTVATGTAASIEVKAHTAAALGFAQGLTTGFDAVLDVLTLDGETVGTGDAVNIDAVTAAEVKTVVEADIAGVVVTDDPGGIILSTVAVGAAASLEVKAHTAAALGFDVGLAAGDLGLNDVVTVDIGIGAGADADVLADGANVAAGAGTGMKYTSGANGVGRDRLDLGGKSLRVKVESDDNVDTINTGSLTVEALYVVI